jgi:hypothetical protein
MLDGLRRRPFLGGRDYSDLNCQRLIMSEFYEGLAEILEVERMRSLRARAVRRLEFAGRRLHHRADRRRVRHHGASGAACECKTVGDIERWWRRRRRKPDPHDRSAAATRWRPDRGRGLLPSAEGRRKCLFRGAVRRRRRGHQDDGRAHPPPRAENVTTSDLCEAAAERLLDQLGWERDSVDGMIFVTQSPITGCRPRLQPVHGRMGLRVGAIAFDVNLGCSGYPYGLWLAMMGSRPGDEADAACRRRHQRKTIDQPTAPPPCCSAIAVRDGDRAATDERLRDFILGSDGGGADNLIVPNGAFRTRSQGRRQVRRA